MVSIDLRGTRSVCVNQALLDICDGDYCAAMVLRQIQHIHDEGREGADLARRRADFARSAAQALTDTGPGWFAKTAQEMSDDILGVYGRRLVQEALAYLVEKGYLLARLDPDIPTLRTRQYLFNVARVQAAVAAWRSSRSSPLPPNLPLEVEPAFLPPPTAAHPQAGIFAPPQPPEAGSFAPTGRQFCTAVPQEAGKIAGAYNVFLDLALEAEKLARAPLSHSEEAKMPAGKNAGTSSAPVAPAPAQDWGRNLPASSCALADNSDDTSVELTLARSLSERGLDARAIARGFQQRRPERIAANLALYDQLQEHPDTKKRPGPGWLIRAIQDDIAADRESAQQEKRLTRQERQAEIDRQADLRTVRAPKPNHPPTHPPTNAPATPEEAHAILSAMRSKLAGRMTMPPAEGGATQP